MKLTSVLLIMFCFFSCTLNDTDSKDNEDEDISIFSDVTETNLPISTISSFSMDVEVADFDNDGDIDVIIANEFRSNIFLLNDGTGKFTDESDTRLPRTTRDSEDIAVDDFDNDGDLDIVIVSEDDQTNEMYLNNGNGFFTDVSSRIIVGGTSNAVAIADLNDDGFTDLVIGNAGQNTILINNGSGFFANETSTRLPSILDVTQDLEFGDVDGDDDLDLLVGNEDSNRLLMNNGIGVFVDQSQERIPLRVTNEETREADFGDVDGDGDLDIIFGNVNAFVTNADPQNRLLINEGTGYYLDQTVSRIPQIANRSFDVDFIDIDSDGDLDILSCDSQLGNNFTEPFRVFLNDGFGNFSNQTSDIFPNGIVGSGFDAEAADFNNDGKLDLYLASRGSADKLLFGK
jgi:hypothetical protein